jgi:GntR family transcriptional regulator
MTSEPMIEFRLDRRSGVPAYRQIIDQVRHAVHLGILQPGDQLPTVRDVVKQITINPNTVHRAYLELELQGLTEGRTGSGTFIRQTLSEVSHQQTKLLGQLELWIKRAREAGLQVEAIEALIAEAMHAMKEEEMS